MMNFIALPLDYANYGKFDMIMYFDGGGVKAPSSSKSSVNTV
jgi:hypothetical protein